jgi:hypothetical protein
MYEEHERIKKIGEMDCRNHHNDRKQTRNKCHSIKSRTQPTQSTTGRNPKTLKILHIFCILLAPCVRRNWNVQTEVNAKIMR